MLVVMIEMVLVITTTAMTMVMMIVLYPDSMKGQWSHVALAEQPLWATCARVGGDDGDGDGYDDNDSNDKDDDDDNGDNDDDVCHLH